MRNPYICRQCLSRLRHSSSKPPRLVRFSSIHAEALRTKDDPPTWRTPGPVQEQAPAAATTGVRIHKVFGRRGEGAPRFASNYAGHLSEDLIKTKILSTNDKFDYLLDDFGSVYGFKQATARDTICQLKALFRGRRRREVADLLDRFLHWKTEFSFLLQDLGQEPEPISDFAAEDERWAIFSDGRAPSVDSMKTAWLQSDTSKREILWPDMVSSMMRSNPGLVPSFIEATYDSSWSPSYIVEDVLHLLLMQNQSNKVPDAGQVVQLIFFLLKCDPSHRLYLTGQTISKVISLMDTEQVMNLYQILKSRGFTLVPRTLLHFASRFGKSLRHKALGTEIICSLAATGGFDLNGPAAASVCTSIFGLDERNEVPEADAAPDVLFKTALEAGLRPNLIHLTALMRNLCVRNRADTAWAIFDMLPRYGIEPDEHVYSTLLNAAKASMDVSSTQRLISELQSRHAFNTPIVNDFLEIILLDNQQRGRLGRRQRKSKNAFRPMLQMYAKFFRLEPLQKLCYFPLEDYLVSRGWSGQGSSKITSLAAGLKPLPEAQLLEPDTVTLTLMLSACVQSLPKSARPSPQPLLRSYHHFTGLMKSGDPLAVELVENHGTLVYDIFLKGMVQFRGCLESAMRLVLKMQQRAKTRAKQHPPNLTHKHKPTICYPPPSVHTWTILMEGFRNHKRPVMAELVLKMMRNAGVEPNQVTWNNLVGAYTWAGSAKGAVTALQQMEQAGFQADRYTIEAFNRLHSAEREKALKLIGAGERFKMTGVDGEGRKGSRRQMAM